MFEYRHAAYNVGTGVILNCERGCQLKRAVKTANFYRFYGESTEWIFATTLAKSGVKTAILKTNGTGSRGFTQNSSKRSRKPATIEGATTLRLRLFVHKFKNELTSSNSKRRVHHGFSYQYGRNCNRLRNGGFSHG